MRIPTALSALGVVVAMAGGCSHRSHTAAPSPVSASTSAPDTTAATAAPATTTATPVLPSTSAPAAATAVARCITSGLAVTVTSRGAAAGTEFLELDFKNTAARACTLEGYPGVSFVDARGTQIGPAVARSSGSAGQVRVAPGAAVGALIAYHDVVVGGDNCQPATATGIRVYPPSQTVSVVVPESLAVCANPAFSGTASVSPVALPADLHPG